MSSRQKSTLLSTDYASLVCNELLEAISQEIHANIDVSVSIFDYFDMKIVLNVLHFML